jgi:leucyl/phenylalanyl-tRNA--protein transferase
MGCGILWKVVSSVPVEDPPLQKVPSARWSPTGLFIWRGRSLQRRDNAPQMIPWLPENDDSAPFPDTRHALGPDTQAPGLLAAGGSLRPQRLRAAYAHGIFPWYSEGQPLLWWSPQPRMVLPVAEFRFSRSLRKTAARFLQAPGCELRIDCACPEVIAACSKTPRDGQNGTWIVPAMVRAYTRWHAAGAVHSFETWMDGKLAGGLYGVNLGRMFFGESMFAHRTDASKIALAALVCFCREHGIAWIDCQQETAHLASLGARPVLREVFEEHLARVVGQDPPRQWSYDVSLWAHLGLRHPTA